MSCGLDLQLFDGKGEPKHIRTQMVGIDGDSLAKIAKNHLKHKAIVLALGNRDQYIGL